VNEGFDWRWVLRRRCMMTASARVEHGEVVIRLCSRWRWHGGACRG
jgi:hypothetical protein